MNFLLTAMAFFTEHQWVIPAIGVLVASLAFVMGRRLFGGRNRRAGSNPTDEVFRGAFTSKPNERRSTPRRRGNLVEVYLSDDSNSPPVNGVVVDRSAGGLCLIVEKEVTEGAILNVRPRKAPQTAPWTPVEIRSCRPDHGEWEVGCRFVKTPAWNDLLLFG
jgi:hypothetical protein